MACRLSLRLGGLAAAGLLFIQPTGYAQRTRSAPSSTPPGAPTPSLDVVSGLPWRNIGPFRGGRATTIAGVPGNPLRYYLGATGGGIWRTDDAGYSWQPIADGQIAMGSVGSLAVAPDDPNVIYAGMGEAPVRGVSSSFGDGVYRSTDAGKTWVNVGLKNTRTISRVIVHPKNSDLVYVAAQGSRWGAGDRGVYRSADGGKNWQRVFAIDSLVGPSELAMDPTNPRILYVAMWDHQRSPWFVRSGGPNSGIWKSTDGGDTWNRLTGGLPTLMGKIGVSVSATNPSRIWAIVEAEQGGLYRSDDAGQTWKLVNGDHVLQARSWYYMRVIADPTNADVVYVINAPMLKSIDAGKSFVTMADPHGDNHDLWINPANPSNIAKADDGGGVISFNGGTTWSSNLNQPTAQFYRVSVDEQFPYWLYSGQQDNSSVAVPSGVMGPGIGIDEFHSAGGCESAHVAFDPANPRYLYGNCYLGIISEYDRVLKLDRNIMAYPLLPLSEPSDQLKYRGNWSSPIITSPHDRKVIYHGLNVVLRSNDRGQSWTAISPDLTRNDKSKQGQGGGPITNEGAGGEVYGTIYYLAESPHEAGVIWAGTDDGLVQLTRDGGRSWTNVTPKGLAESLINMVEVSPHDKATAYIAVSRIKWNDNTPHIFKTVDYGATWTRLVQGLPAEENVRVVREDPVRKNLLYAGTETGVWVSFDGGANWQRLQQNLPHVPVTDLRVHHGDLVISTEGRAFWIMDDIGALRDLTPETGKTGAVLFQPRTTYRTAIGANMAVPGLGQNVPKGALISYWLPSGDSAITTRLEILDPTGAVVRAFTTDAKMGESNRLVVKKGFNRLVWDLATAPATRVTGIMVEGNGGGGYRVAPGHFQVKLTAGADSKTQSFDVVVDPRTNPSQDDIRGQQDLLAKIRSRVDGMHTRINAVRGVREQINALIERTKGRPEADSVAKAGAPLIAAIDSTEKRIINVRSKTFQDAVNYRHALNEQYLDLLNAIDGTDAPVTKGMQIRFADLEEAWNNLAATLDQTTGPDLTRFNGVVKALAIPSIVTPAK